MKKLSGLIVLCLFLSACAEAQFLAHTAKRVGGDSAPFGNYKIGNPYQIKGTWYYPAVDYNYDETGIASWYGPNFDGKLTANGDVYDQYAMTAAHRTLPMPSVVRVTNLENGRSLVVTINDRGPFAKGRIIDMSKRGAELLGFKNQGTARVRVQILDRESRQIAAASQPRGPALSVEEAPIKVAAPAKETVQAESLAPVGGAKTDRPVASPARGIPPVSAPPEISAQAAFEPLNSGEVTQQPISPTSLFVQAGAFGVFDNANQVRARLSGFGNVQISQVLINGRDLYRVRLGPVPSVARADQLLAEVIDAGYPGARVVVD